MNDVAYTVGVRRALETLGVEKIAKTALPPVEAYVTGPSGAGKTTYVKENYPEDQFHRLHSDAYKKMKGLKRVFEWRRAIRDATASGKPVVVDSMGIHKPLAAAAKDKVLLQVPEDVSVQRRQARNFNAQDADAAEGHLTYEFFKKKIRPTADRLGFVEKQSRLRSDAGIRSILQKLKKRTKPGEVSHQMRNDRLPGSGAGWDPGGHDI